MGRRSRVAVVVGASSKWRANGANTILAHGRSVDDQTIPIESRWGVGGALAFKFAKEGFSVALTTRSLENVSPLAHAVQASGGDSLAVEMDLTSADSISRAFDQICRERGEPEAVIYNAGYLFGRDLPADHELMEHVPLHVLDSVLHVCGRGPLLVAQNVLPAMRKRGSGSFLITNNGSCLQGRRRQTGQALSYPRALLRSFAQALTEEYSQYGVHIANVIIDGVIDSPGTRALPIAEQRPELVMNPSRIAEAYFYLHTQDRTCWSHELILSPNGHRPSIENSWRFGTRDGKPAAVR